MISLPVKPLILTRISSFSRALSKWTDDSYYWFCSLIIQLMICIHFELVFVYILLSVCRTKLSEKATRAGLGSGAWMSAVVHAVVVANARESVTSSSCSGKTIYGIFYWAASHSVWKSVTELQAASKWSHQFIQCISQQNDATFYRFVLLVSFTSKHYSSAGVSLSLEVGVLSGPVKGPNQILSECNFRKKHNFYDSEH